MEKDRLKTVAYQDAKGRTLMERGELKDTIGRWMEDYDALAVYSSKTITKLKRKNKELALELTEAMLNNTDNS